MSVQAVRNVGWQIGDECVVRDPSRVWAIAGWLDESQTIADLTPVGFEFAGTHSAPVDNLRTPPTEEIQ